ncbi:3-hydroxyacyl-CoA dehydrogenase family protein [Nocardia jinanensis]|uniref:3-hydroxybutyryl-CoA dehydrogenase n=1 Tax=Nocardia jinanensis TaxID=382504 RepID=A0A917RKD2_9NOCA|nr:3-hydroxyacyl-CoA dehydrogenase family protein [Nocardia jinanensis]GGL12653.1 3-hydroxybutyryl-CoA dehydrogenase [Nocardia jinanensis]
MTNTTGERLLVLGAGTMGTQIALQSALCGIEVALVDISTDAVDRARTEIDGLLTTRVAKGRITEQEERDARARLTLSAGLDAVAPVCTWAIEAVVEKLDVKQAVFRRLAELLPSDAGIATNSSHIRAATIAGDAEYADRCLNMHYFHPVLVMDLVEVVASPRTRPDILERARGWADRMKRTPVVLTKDVDGFLVNRVLGAASREAFSLLGTGVATVEEIDIAVRRGLRWPLGPFELADLSGLDVLLESRTARYEKHGEIGDRLTVEVIRPLVEAGRLGRKAGAGFYDYSVNPPKPLPIDIPAGDDA